MKRHRKSKSISENERRALLKLLVDDDPDVIRGLTRVFVDMDRDQFHSLAGEFDPQAGDYPEAFIHAHRRIAVQEFLELSRSLHHHPDLETGLVLISAWGNPGFSRRRPRLILDGYASRIREHAAGARDTGELVQAICRYLFDDVGFRGTEEAYQTPHGSFLMSVLDNKTGIPISLSSVVLLLADRLRIKVHPIGSAGYFLLAADWSGERHYIDAFGGGRILSASEALELLPPDMRTARAFPVVDAREVLARTLRNLRGLYERSGDPHHAQSVVQMMSFLQTE